MASQRAQGQFERARWRLLYLAPLWILQLVLAMLLLGLFSRRLALSVHKFDWDIEGDIPNIIFVWQSINIVMSFAVGLCIIIEIAKYLSESLTPWTMLFTNIIKTTGAAVIMVFDLVVYIQRRDQQYSLVSLVIDSSLLVSAVTTVVYAAVAKRRSSVYDNHPLPANAKGFGFQDGLARASTRSSTEKASRSSVASSRTTAALMDPEPAMSPPGEPSMTSPPTQYRYNHERSTKFDEYMSLYGPMHRDSESESSSLRSHIQDQHRSQGSRDSATAASRTVARSRVTSPGSRHRSHSVEQTLRPVPEEGEDVVLVGAGLRSTDGTGSDVSTASVSLMSSSSHDEYVTVQKKAKTRP